MFATPLPIVGLGATTSIGRTVRASAAAARAATCGFREHAYMVDMAGEPMRIAAAPWLDSDLGVVERYLALLCPALEEALEPVRGLALRRISRLGLFTALPPERPGRPADLPRRVLRDLSERFRDVLSNAAVFPDGHASGYEALDAAIRLIRAGTLDACLVAGVDSYLFPETLEWIEACDQLNGAGHQNNAWGFIPGEAGAALLVCSPECAGAAGGPVWGDVVAVGLGRETKLIKTDAVCVGEGLTEAFRNALAGLPSEERIHAVICDLNGETYRADEYGFTILRVQERFMAADDFVAPADCWGDVGAAGAALHVALALITATKRGAKGPNALAWGSSESGVRGAAVIRAASGEQ